MLRDQISMSLRQGLRAARTVLVVSVPAMALNSSISQAKYGMELSMMKKTFWTRCSTLLGALVLVTSLGLAPAAHADSGFGMSYSGTFTTVPAPVPPMFLTTDTLAGVGTQLGQFTGTYPHLVNLGTLAFSGTATFTAANGDKLDIQLSGTATPTSPTTFNLSSQGPILGGTGRFRGASGSVSGTGTVTLTDPDNLSGTVTTTLLGQINLS
jgi:hypothetical protein